MAEMPNGFPARPASYDKKVGLVLQGGGALGSYQAGVYEALASSEYLPDWVIFRSAASVRLVFAEERHQLLRYVGSQRHAGAIGRLRTDQ